MGSVYSVAVDIRDNSLSYGKWYGVLLNEENNKQFLIPKGFAHGFSVLSDEVTICYKCDEFYHPEDECGIIWNDSEINIHWIGVNKDTIGSGIYTLNDGTPIVLSEKDRCFRALCDITPVSKN